MGFTIKVNIDGKLQEIGYFNNPDICPICYKNQVPNKLFDTGIITNDGLIQIVYQCTNSNCRNLFIGEYTKINRMPGQKRYSSVEYILKDLNPKKPSEVNISNEISNLSPKFIEIYKESYFIESLGAINLFGMGLRKALEFLIKDYCIYKFPEKKNDILKKFLSQCIQIYIKDDRISDCAKRAAWIGNDESHYERLWLDKDIEDLKILLKLTINWIESELLTSKYSEEMKK